MTEIEQEVINALKDGELDYAAIANGVSFYVMLLPSVLRGLEANGRIEEGPKGIYRLKEADNGT